MNLTLLNFIIKPKPKISVFIPIYNRENFIAQCIHSVQTQTLKDIEIVAVNDCSDDNTLNILKDLAKNDNRIKIVNNDRNHGLLYSRAMGILNSTGKYLMNLDSGDKIYGNDSLEFLYNISKSLKLDITAFNIFDKKRNISIKCRFTNEFHKQPKLLSSIFLENNQIKDFMI